MQSNDAPLPNDLEACQAELARLRAELQHLEHVAAERAATCEKQAAEIERLKAELNIFKRYVFGRRSERHVDSPGQQYMPFDEPEEDSSDPSPTPGEASEEEITYRRRRRGYGWSRIPDHIPRIDIVLDVDPSELDEEGSGKKWRKIGEDITDVIDIKPATVIHKRYIRPKYVLEDENGEDRVVQEPAPPLPVPGGRYGFGFVTEIITSKFGFHLPLYRQQDILAAAGLEIGRSTLCDIVSNVAELLEPLADLMRQRVLAADMLGADDTPVRLRNLANGGGLQTARFWLYRGMEEAPYNVFDFHPTRERDGPKTFLENFTGWVKVDAYGVENGVYLGSAGRILASCCMAHARRKFEQAKVSHPSLASEAMAFFRQVYDIEDGAEQMSAQDRLELRQTEAKPITDRLKAWLEKQRETALPKSKLGEAIRYTLNQWDELMTYLTDGRLPIDNNATERDLRQLTIGRKNWLFIGSDAAGPRAATIYTVVASAVRNDLDVWAYLHDVLQRLAEGTSDLTSLLPDVWAKSHPESIRTYRQHEREARATEKRRRRQHRRRMEAARQTADC